MIETEVSAKSDSQKREEQTIKAGKQSYSAPELHVIGVATALVQGCGGMAGSDRSYYRVYCN